MSLTRHFPDPLHQRETLCGARLTGVGANAHFLASVGDSVSCPDCRTIVNMAVKCVSPHRYLLVKTP